MREETALLPATAAPQRGWHSFGDPAEPGWTRERKRCRDGSRHHLARADRAACICGAQRQRPDSTQVAGPPDGRWQVEIERCVVADESTSARYGSRLELKALQIDI